MTIPQLRSPIILVHGLFGFDRLRMGSWVMADYFPGIAEALRQAGNRVLVASLSPTAGIAERARQLKKLLDRECPAEPVHIFGHSMGGLDARYLISRLGMARRVLSLTTIGTPHRGSSFADWGVRRLANLVQPIFSFLGLSNQAFFDLTIANCRKFNAETQDVPGIRYFSVAGKFECGWTSPEWQLPATVITLAEGANDGIVSVKSATYGETCEIWAGDHLNLVNWHHPLASERRDRVPDYARLVRRLADEGF
jgi:triacylglycerol lipase